MSKENIKVLGAFNEAFNQRDFDDAAQYLDRAVEINPGVMAPDHDSKLLGHNGWKEFIRVAIEAWETVAAEPLERIETRTAGFSPSIYGAFGVGEASRSRGSFRLSTRFETASSCESMASPKRPRPSKPPDCRSNCFGPKQQRRAR